MTSSKADTVINKTYRVVLERYDVIIGKTRLLYIKPIELFLKGMTSSKAKTRLLRPVKLFSVWYDVNISEDTVFY